MHNYLFFDEAVFQSDALSGKQVQSKPRLGFKPLLMEYFRPAPQSLRLRGRVCQSVTDIKLNPKQGRLKTENHYLKVGDFAEPKGNYNRFL